ncbi:MAG TPA: methyltransferase domain-containing protein [Acetobacteraceae bacterium]|nr:methyltransferase domain-containing protein [Acetobacteraceae bacterium]
MSETQVIDWENRYQIGKTGWERASLHPAFLAWRRSGELAPCRILVPGAGRSPEPEALVEAGFAVTVLDVAASAAAAQRQRLGTRAEIVQADLFTWEPAVPFDAVYDQTCLCALPPALMPDYEQRLARWLRPGGVLCVLFMQSGGTGGPPFDCPIPEMQRLFSAERWVWPEALPPLVPHPSLREEQPALLRRR